MPPRCKARSRERWPGRPVEILFNTNWRDEHTGANAALRGAGATVMAHENTKLWLGGDFFVDWEDRHYAPHPAAMLPNKTFYTSGNARFRRPRASSTGTCRARTRTATSRCSFRDANVLVASDLALGRPLSRARLLDGRLDRRARRRDAEAARRDGRAHAHRRGRRAASTAAPSSKRSSSCARRCARRRPRRSAPA